MTNDEIYAIRNLVREELALTENKMREDLALTENKMREDLISTENRIMGRVEVMQEETLVRVDERMKVVQTETMKGAAVLLDSQFMGQFNLLFEKIEEVLRKIPSDEDIDIIDDTLREHGSEIKILRQDVNELKRAL